jgi:hypothetical protein
MGRAFERNIFPPRFIDTSMTRTTYMLRKVLSVTLAVLLLASAASAATITYTLDKTVPGQFTLYADVSAGDNFGLAAYGVPLLGNVTNLNNTSPLSINTANFAPLGFDQFRLPAAGTDPVVAPTVNPTIRGAQNSISGPGANFIFGLGQSANSFAGLGYTTLGAAQDPTSDQSWNAHLKLGSGNYTGELHFDLANVDLVGNVWLSNDRQTRTTPAATVSTVELVIPEPATLSLFGLALVGGFGLIRRRAA